MNFETNVFINCPFDSEYRSLLKPLLFTILYLDLEPLISETESSGYIRINEIRKLISHSKYSIHDISRSEPLTPGDLPRFNMSYEMGLDIGCQYFGSRKLKSKQCLILDKEKYRYQKTLSDISGQDIKDHNNDPQRLISKVREWFVKILGQHLPGATTIWNTYTEFIADLTVNLADEGFNEKEIDELPYSNFILIARLWIENYKVAFS
ncbi:MAG: hypothetical protein M3342_19110 [Bacteroidota bacterium]|nr:hypothetical protein [Bacteroidota bacterium]